MRRERQSVVRLVLALTTLSCAAAVVAGAQGTAIGAVGSTARVQGASGAAQSTAASTQPGVAGTWLMRYERQSAPTHSEAPGTVEVVTGRLTLRQSGDSLFGEWQTLVAKGDTAPPPRSVHGVQRGDSAFLRYIPVVDPDAGFFASIADGFVEFIKTYVHGMPPTTTALDFVRRGDVVTGTRHSVLLDGTPRGKEVALTGVRANP